MIQGIRNSTTDIDICVKDLKGLESLGEIKQWRTDSVFSKSGDRAGIESQEYLIDIFVEKELPKHIEINGIKVQTLDSLLEEYNRVLVSLTDPIYEVSINKMKNKISNLKDKINGDKLNILHKH